MNNEIGVYVGNEQRIEKPIVLKISNHNKKQNNFIYGTAGEGRCFHVNDIEKNYDIDIDEVECNSKDTDENECGCCQREDAPCDNCVRNSENTDKEDPGLEDHYFHD